MSEEQQYRLEKELNAVRDRQEAADPAAQKAAAVKKTAKKPTKKKPAPAQNGQTGAILVQDQPVIKTCRGHASRLGRARRL